MKAEAQMVAQQVAVNDPFSQESIDAYRKSLADRAVAAIGENRRTGRRGWELKLLEGMEDQVRGAVMAGMDPEKAVKMAEDRYNQDANRHGRNIDATQRGRAITIAGAGRERDHAAAREERTVAAISKHDNVVGLWEKVKAAEDLIADVSTSNPLDHASALGKLVKTIYDAKPSNEEREAVSKAGGKWAAWDQEINQWTKNGEASAAFLKNAFELAQRMIPVLKKRVDKAGMKAWRAIMSDGAIGASPEDRRSYADHAYGMITGSFGAPITEDTRLYNKGPKSKSSFAKGQAAVDDEAKAKRIEELRAMKAAAEKKAKQ